jgi:hypothetical protein
MPPGRSLLSYLFSRLGADVGACIRGMYATTPFLQ